MKPPAGSIDIPWDQVEVHGNKPLPDFEVTDYQVVMRARRRHACIDFFRGELDNV